MSNQGDQVADNQNENLDYQQDTEVEELESEIQRLTIERDEARLAQTAVVAPVSIKLPVFWPTEPRAWFVQTDAQFTVKKITSDSTKYAHLVAALDKETTVRILDWLEAPPVAAGTRYDALTAILMGTLSLTRRERAQKLNDLGQLGDELPSKRYDRMRAIRGTESAELLWEELFLRQLPDDVQRQLANENMSDMKAFAKKADGIILATKRSASINIVRPQTPRSPSPRPKPKPAADGLCWAHRRFGKEANRCRLPESCKMAGNAMERRN